MSERAPFLNIAYSAYHHRERPPEDEELTRVGPGTPCGEYLRRFWQPVILSSELGELPRRLRILGEDLVAFRDKSGAIGLLELHCPHRGTSLEFGLIGDKGIRCCYHGWLFDVDGTILETPGEPADSTLKDRLFHGAYPVREYSGLVFAYMGPPDKQPDFPILDTYELPGYRQIARAPTLWECNWLQVKENSMDPAHLAFLHTLPGSEGFTDDFKELGRVGLDGDPGRHGLYRHAPAGRSGVGARRRLYPPQHPPVPAQRGPDGAAQLDQSAAWRPPGRCRSTTRHTMQIGYQRAPEGREVRRGSGFGQDGKRSYEERQRVPGDYDAQISIHGGVSRHGLEHLASDRSRHHHDAQHDPAGDPRCPQRRGSGIPDPEERSGGADLQPRPGGVGHPPGIDARGGQAPAARGRAQRGGANGAGRLRRSIVAGCACRLSPRRPLGGRASV